MPDNRDCMRWAAPLGAGAPYPGGRASTQPVSQAEHLTAAWSGDDPGPCWAGKLVLGKLQHCNKL